MNSGTPAVFPSVGTNHDILGQNIGAKYLSTPIKEFYHLMTQKNTAVAVQISHISHAFSFSSEEGEIS